MKERFVIVFIAVALGLLITTVGFLIYQSTKVVSSTPASEQKEIIQTKTETSTNEKNGHFIKISDPKDESITAVRTVKVKGETTPGSTVIVSSNQEDTGATASSDGKFSTTITIDAGANKIITRSIAPDGTIVTDERVITYSTDDF